MLFSRHPFSLASILVDPFVVGVAAGGLVELLPGVKRVLTTAARRRSEVRRAARATFVERGGETLAVLVHDRALLEHPRLVEAVTAAARLALDNERLQAQLRTQLDELRASRARLVHAADGERRRLERNLHDGAQQRLVSLALDLRMVDVGGGLGIDYDGSQTDFESSVNYTLQEYANDVVYHIQNVCDEAEVPHPTIITESGRAVARSYGSRRSCSGARCSSAVGLPGRTSV